MANRSLADAIGSERFSELLSQELARRHADLEFLDLGNVYLQDVRFDAPTDGFVADDGSAHATVVAHFTAVEPSHSCSAATPTETSATLEVIVDGKSGDLSFRVTDAPWHLLTSRDDDL